MTRLERLQAERDKLIIWRNEAMNNNDFMNMTRTNEKIAAKEKEIEEAKKYQPMRLLDILNEKGEEAKDRVYKALLKISLACDYVAKCSYDAKEVLDKLGISDYTFRSDLEEMRKLSDKLAGFVCIPNQTCLTNMIVYDDEFIETCDKAADKRLKETLKL